MQLQQIINETDKSQNKNSNIIRYILSLQFHAYTQIANRKNEKKNVEYENRLYNIVEYWRIGLKREFQFYVSQSSKKKKNWEGYGK